MNTMLGRIGDLFRHRWDPHVITVLARQPLRYRALSRCLQAEAGEQLDDNTLTRCLHRLIRGGHVTADTQRVGRRGINVYRLTAQGHQQLTAYRSLVTVYEKLAVSSGGSGVWPHHPHSSLPHPESSGRIARDGVAPSTDVRYEEPFRGSRSGES